MSKIDTLDPKFHEKVNQVRLEALKQTGYEWAVVSATRTIKEQHALYVESKDGDGVQDNVTNADGGQSPHNFGKACDLAPVAPSGAVIWTAPKEVWEKMGLIAESLGLVWGGHFKKLYDAPHIEDPSWKQDQAAWKQGKLQVA